MCIRMRPKRVGDAVRKARERQGLTQQQLAKAAKVSQPYLSQIESGSVKDPAVSRMHRIAKALGVKIEDLL